MSETLCHQCGQPLLEDEFVLDCPGCQASFHGCCWPAHGGACLEAHPPRPLIAPLPEQHLPLPPTVVRTLEPNAPIPIDAHPNRCRECRALIPADRAFCFECGDLPFMPGGTHRLVLLVEATTSARTARQAVGLLSRLVPSISAEELQARLEQLPLLLFVEIELERLHPLQQRLEREGLRVRLYPEVSRAVVVREFVEQWGRQTGMVVELGGIGLFSAVGLVFTPLAAVAGGLLAAWRLSRHVGRFVRRFTVPRSRLEPLLYPLAGERGERIRQLFKGLRTAEVRELGRLALVAYEQGMAAACGEDGMLEHLWRPVEPMLTRYLEQLMVLAARGDRLEQYLAETAQEEGSHGPGGGVRREDIAGAGRVMRARLERSVAMLQSLRAGLLQLSIQEAGPEPEERLEELAQGLEREIDAMLRAMREVEGLRLERDEAGRNGPGTRLERVARVRGAAGVKSG